MHLERLEAVVRGRVQGVGFRFFVKAEALLHGVKGFARNLPDGSVEVVAEGAREKLENLLNALKRGPPTARVDKVSKRFSPVTSGFSGFSIMH